MLIEARALDLNLSNSTERLTQTYSNCQIFQTVALKSSINSTKPNKIYKNILSTTDKFLQIFSEKSSCYAY